jgi:pilus assembly protein Flp/PilA
VPSPKQFETSAEEEKQMTKIINMTMKLKIWKDNHGQDLMEYALMAGFLAAASGYTLPAVASDIASVLTKVVAMLAGGGADTAPGA